MLTIGLAMLGAVVVMLTIARALAVTGAGW